MNRYIVLILMLLLCSLMTFGFTPQADIDLRNHYQIVNGSNISATAMYINGNSVMTNISQVNSSKYWDDLNTPLDITSLGNSTFEYFSGTELNATNFYHNGNAVLDLSGIDGSNITSGTVDEDYIEDKFLKNYGDTSTGPINMSDKLLIVLLIVMMVM